jgi:hypothetical protein
MSESPLEKEGFNRLIWRNDDFDIGANLFQCPLFLRSEDSFKSWDHARREIEWREELHTKIIPHCHSLQKRLQVTQLGSNKTTKADNELVKLNVKIISNLALPLFHKFLNAHRLIQNMILQTPEGLKQESAPVQLADLGVALHKGLRIF